jgi:hypothetical protein
MRWYFNKHGWPTSTILPAAPQDEAEQAKLIDTLQDWKSEKYRDFIGSGKVLPRPGIVEVRIVATALLTGVMSVFFSFYAFMKNCECLELPFFFAFPSAFCFTECLADGSVLVVYRVQQGPAKEGWGEKLRPALLAGTMSLLCSFCADS